MLDDTTPPFPEHDSTVGHINPALYTLQRQVLAVKIYEQDS